MKFNLYKLGLNWSFYSEKTLHVCYLSLILPLSCQLWERNILGEFVWSPVDSQKVRFGLVKMCASADVVNNPWGLRKQNPLFVFCKFCSCLVCCRSRKVVDAQTSKTPTPVLALTEPPLSADKWVHILNYSQIIMVWSRY